MKIRFTLDENSIDEARKSVVRYKKEFAKKNKEFVRRLLDVGADIASMEVLRLGAFDKGELASSFETMMFTDGKSGIIFTGCSHAAFVEFGVGVVGAGSPHPTMPWQYDINNHGDSGWVYYDEDEGRFRWTKGMPSRPYMYNTTIELARRVEQIAEGVFKT